MGTLRTERWASNLRAFASGSVAKSRERYASIREDHECDPRDDAHSPSVNNPLMPASEETPWAKHFKAREVRDLVAKDLERLHPGEAFYNAKDVQAALCNVLTAWALVNPEVGYRQGMHELASLIFFYRASDAAAGTGTGTDAGATHAWGEGGDPPPMRPIDANAPALSSTYVEHDTYAMFDAFLGPTRDARRRRANANERGDDATGPPFVNVVAYYEDAERRGGASEVQRACDRVFAVLDEIDASTSERMRALGVEPQLFCLRWLRLAFTREFHLDDAARVWDAIADANAGDDRGDGHAAMDFMEAFAVSMIVFVRGDVADAEDFGGVVKRLQKFPPACDIDVLVSRAGVIAPAVKAVREGKDVPTEVLARAGIELGIPANSVAPGTGTGTGTGTFPGAAASASASASASGSGVGGGGDDARPQLGAKANEFLIKAKDASAGVGARAADLFANIGARAKAAMANAGHSASATPRKNSGNGNGGDGRGVEVVDQARSMPPSPKELGSAFGGLGFFGGGGGRGGGGAAAGPRRALRSSAPPPRSVTPPPRSTACY